MDIIKELFAWLMSVIALVKNFIAGFGGEKNYEKNTL